MDPDSGPVNHRHRPTSPPDNVDSGSRHRAFDHFPIRSPVTSAFSGPDYRRERLPPILDWSARPHQRQQISSASTEHHGHDLADFRSPAGMVAADHSHLPRPTDTGVRASTATRLFDQTRPEGSSSHASAYWSESDPVASSSQLHKNSDVGDTSGTYRVKRPRVSLACLFCRNRKSRCDGVRPTCKTCAHLSKYFQP